MKRIATSIAALAMLALIFSPWMASRAEADGMTLNCTVGATNGYFRNQQVCPQAGQAYHGDCLFFRSSGYFPPGSNLQDAWLYDGRSGTYTKVGIPQAYPSGAAAVSGSFTGMLSLQGPEMPPGWYELIIRATSFCIHACRSGQQSDAAPSAIPAAGLIPGWTTETLARAALQILPGSHPLAPTSGATTFTFRCYNVAGVAEAGTASDPCHAGEKFYFSGGPIPPQVPSGMRYEAHEYPADVVQLRWMGDPSQCPFEPYARMGHPTICDFMTPSLLDESGSPVPIAQTSNGLSISGYGALPLPDAVGTYQLLLSNDTDDFELTGQTVVIQPPPPPPTPKPPPPPTHLTFTVNVNDGTGTAPIVHPIVPGSPVGVNFTGIPLRTSPARSTPCTAQEVFDGQNVWSASSWEGYWGGAYPHQIRIPQDAAAGNHTLSTTVTCPDAVYAGSSAVVVQVPPKPAPVPPTPASVQPTPPSFSSQPSGTLPTVRLDPATLAQGQQTRIIVTGFAVNANLTIRLDSIVISKWSDFEQSDGFVKEYSVPTAIASGSHTVTVDDSYGHHAEATLTVVGTQKPPEIQVDPTLAVPGSTLHVTGSGWADQWTYHAYLDGSSRVELTMQTQSTHTQKKIDQLWTLPPNISPGKYRIIVADGFNQASADVQVIGNNPLTGPARLVLNPTQGPVGSQVVLSASGLTPRATALVRLDGHRIGMDQQSVWQIDDHGSFTDAVISIPSFELLGVHHVNVSDGLGHDVSADFTVTAVQEQPKPMPPTPPQPAPEGGGNACNPGIPMYQQPGCRPGGNTSAPPPQQPAPGAGAGACNPAIPMYQQPGCGAASAKQALKGKAKARLPRTSASPPSQNAHPRCDPNIPRYAQPGCVDQ